jgi:hypothetical protein
VLAPGRVPIGLAVRHGGNYRSGRPATRQTATSPGRTAFSAARATGRLREDSWSYLRISCGYYALLTQGVGVNGGSHGSRQSQTIFLFDFILIGG